MPRSSFECPGYAGRRLLPLVLVVLGCGRFPGIEGFRQAEDPDVVPSGDAGHVDVSWPDAPSPLPDVRSPDVLAMDAAPVPSRTPTCVPSPEVCNGRDDDCNGQVDEALPPIPCEEGGFRYCVAGRYSACPRSCEVCTPGSQRVCYLSICTYWGVQTCTADGRSFGACTEMHPPRECHAIAQQFQRSRQLERCCIDNGYCCLDEFDLDGDGDRSEALGDCVNVLCGR